MMASFIDSGDALWHDVVSMAACNSGIIALKSNGATETAGRPIVAMDGSRWVSPKGWADAYGRILHVGTPNTGNEYFVVTEDNQLVSSVNGVPVADGLAKAEALERIETSISGGALPAWRYEADVVSFQAKWVSNPEGTTPMELYIGVRENGTVQAEPAFLAELLAGWDNIADVRLLDHCVLGLKKDGTVQLAALAQGNVLDVSAWQNVVAIDAGNDWCVGLKNDGSLVFAGDHIFMNEGHWRQ